ncbi:gluconate 2-dehydrogenase subunit 3 family protein [bacterium]|nr:gluconate 2-dehydrogenase subunit 3 family protein [bacterium]
MRSGEKIARRTFFRVSAVAAAAAGVFGSGCLVERRRWRAFSEAEARLVDDISERIIPSDSDPGGRFAGVVDFIDRQLDGPYERYAASYHDGLPRLARTAEAVHSAPWEKLSDWQQTELLARLEKGDVPEGIWEQGQAREFFALLCEHCLQGYYGPPRHGGNRDYVSYRMLGLDYPQIVGRNQRA